MFDIIPPHDPVPDCDCERCAIVARNQLRAFAQDVMRSWPHGDVDGGDLQETAVRHGLLRLKTPAPKEPCGEDCMCAEYCDADEWAEGVTCYEKTALLTPNG